VVANGGPTFGHSRWKLQVPLPRRRRARQSPGGTDKPKGGFRSSDLTVRRPIDWIGLGGLLFVGLTTFLLCLPTMREMIWLCDKGVLLHGADRLLRGDRLYVDFFEFLPPGGVPHRGVLVRRRGGFSLWSARLLLILTITGIACFTYLACRQASKHALSSAFAIVIVLGWCIISQPFWTQISHHWFTTLFSMLAAWAALASFSEPQGRQWSLIAGIAAGSAAMVVPTRGVLAVLAAATAFLDWRRRRDKLILYVLGTAASAAARNNGRRADSAAGASPLRL
jgi:hypothetical protein